MERNAKHPGDLRMEALARHLDAMRVAYEITGHKTSLSNAIHEAFLSGWDAAMETRSEELLQENQDLHGKLMDIEEFGCIQWQSDKEEWDAGIMSIDYDPIAMGA